jgi:hypothetical protein
LVDHPSHTELRSLLSDLDARGLLIPSSRALVALQSPAWLT